MNSIKNILEILNLFTVENPERSVTEMARLTGLNKSTVSRIAATLSSRQMLARVEVNQKYRLGRKILELANVFRSGLSLGAVSIPFLQDLQFATNETISVFELFDDVFVCIERLERPTGMRHMISIGETAPVFPGAPGKLILAYACGDERKSLLTDNVMELYKGVFPEDAEQLELFFKNIRQKGYATGIQEIVDEHAMVTAPIRNEQGKIIATLNVSGLYSRFTEDNINKYGKLLVEAASKISQAMGCSHSYCKRTIT